MTTATSCSLRLTYGCNTQAGRVLKPNEDCFRIVGPEAVPSEEKGSLFVVADGLGWYGNGEVASGMACEEMLRLYYGSAEPDWRRSLRDAVLQTNELLYATSRPEGKLHGMCTTLAAAAIKDDAISVIHVGDSKCFLFRGGRTVYISTDHCRLVPTFEFKSKRYLTQSLGARHTVVPSEERIQLEDGDTVVLCTDGLSDSLSPGEILTRCGRNDASSAASELISAAKDNGATDDISVIVINVRAG